MPLLQGDRAVPAGDDCGPEVILRAIDLSCDDGSLAGAQCLNASCPSIQRTAAGGYQTVEKQVAAACLAGR